MKLPTNSLIAPEKLTEYLLVQRKRNDKSKWLAQAGYTLDNWQVLENDLRTQILSLEASPADLTHYGQTYEIKGSLIGPNGEDLAVCTVWMVERATGLQNLSQCTPTEGRRNELSII